MKGKERRRDYYLARIKEAVESALKVEDTGAKQSWNSIAQGYRELLGRLESLRG